MAFIIIFVALSIVLFAIYKRKSLEDLYKSQRKLIYDVVMTWVGFRGSTEDFFYRARDKNHLFPQPHKVAVMTGGSRGIGLEVLKKLLQCEITVMVAARDPKSFEEIIESSFAPSLTKGKVFCEKCDTSDMTSVREFAMKVQKRFSAIHLLINNAGILSAPHVITKDGFISQMAVNYFGHFLLTHLLMPQLRAGSKPGENARIVNVSSCVHSIGKIRYRDLEYKKYYRAGMVYSDSKLAQLMFAIQLKAVCEERNWNVQTHSLDPGMVGTDIFKTSVVGPFSKRPFFRLWFKSPEQASRTIVHAAIAPELEGRSGTYIRNCQVFPCSENANDHFELVKLFKYTCYLLKIKDFGNEEIKETQVIR